MIERPIKSLKEEVMFFFITDFYFVGERNWNCKNVKFVEVNPCGLNTKTEFNWNV
jgi:hypothetical protein